MVGCHCAVSCSRHNLADSLGSHIANCINTGNTRFRTLPRHDVTALVQLQLTVHQLRGGLSADTDEHAVDIQDFFLGAAQKCTPDANGRIILDEGLLHYAGISKNIVFVGAGKQIRIWSEEKWLEREQNRNYEEMRNKMRAYGL